ncbi:response regulator [Xylophilus ampelinus]|uniref:Response regulator receiver domain-containing protein n=1 Tax=Xylophilus ampelinus TaxID=54067 RepID=A0A318SH21_9BURK|nr:response regulator [Xylophilus ampelinus]MCS4510276.1 response regulator [Xylophilus ampelinus]PYE78103.1 response regulator receiver domain-containing protein [Xylophilus ampelinus]
MANILVVDDELGIRDLLSEILNDEGHAVELAENAAQARAARAQGSFDLVLLDIWMPDTDGVSLLKEWAATGMLTMPVIMMSGHATIDTAVEATRIGAHAFLEKPITLQKLLKAVEQGLQRSGDAARKAGADANGSAASKPTLLPAEVTAAAPTIAAGFAADATGGRADAQTAPVAADSSAVVPANGAAPRSVQSFDLDRPLREARDGFEKAYFEFHLKQEAGSMTRVAEKTGLERTHLYRKLRQLGVDLTRGRRATY